MAQLDDASLCGEVLPGQIGKGETEVLQSLDDAARIAFSMAHKDIHVTRKAWMGMKSKGVASHDQTLNALPIARFEEFFEVSGCRHITPLKGICRIVS